MSPTLNFAQPQWLWAAPAACLTLAFLFGRAHRRRLRALARFAAAGAETTLCLRRRRLREASLLLAVALLCVALARPLGGFRWEQSPHRGASLMFAVDTSKSMKATDVRPDRLTRAKLAVADLAEKFQGERLGLIAFAGDAFVQTPMTEDRGVFLDSLAALDTDVIPRGGTDVGSAIRAGSQALASQPDRHKALILLSDGEDLSEDAVPAAREAASAGLTVYTVGVGSAAGALVTTGDGQVVRSRLDEPTLRRIAEATGGAYQPLGADGHGLEALFAQARLKLQPTLGAGARHKVYTERFQLPLAMALALLSGELLVGERRRRVFPRRAAAAAVALTSAVPLAAHAAGVADYNQGTATYRNGDYAAARRQFEASLHTEDLWQQEAGYYNLGNTKYRLGQSTLTSQPEATIAAWKEALSAYDAALALKSADADAKFNRDWVARKLAELEQKQNASKKSSPQQGGPSSPSQPQPQPSPGQQASQQQQKAGEGSKASSQQGQQEGSKQAQRDSTGQQAPSPKSGSPSRQGSGSKPQPPTASTGAQGATPSTPQPTTTGQPKAPDAAPRASGQVGTAQARAGTDASSKAEEAQEAAADPAGRAAGELSRREAVQLLDSLQSDLKPLPLRGARGARPDAPHLRDW